MYKTWTIILTIYILEIPQYEDLEHGPGCGSLSLDEHECRIALKKLGYNDQLEKGNWDHGPPGCYVGHQDDGWKYSYFSTVSVGTTGKTGPGSYRSICKKGNYDLTLTNIQSSLQKTIAHYALYHF